MQASLHKLALLLTSSIFWCSSRHRRRRFLSFLRKLLTVLCIVVFDVEPVVLDMLVVFVRTVNELDIFVAVLVVVVNDAVVSLVVFIVILDEFTIVDVVLDVNSRASLQNGAFLCRFTSFQCCV